jgi:hypothetical protein
MSHLISQDVISPSTELIKVFHPPTPHAPLWKLATAPRSHLDAWGPTDFNIICD